MIIPAVKWSQINEKKIKIVNNFMIKVKEKLTYIKTQIMDFFIISSNHTIMLL